MLVALLGALGCTPPPADPTDPSRPTWQDNDVDDPSSPVSPTPSSPITPTTPGPTTPPTLFGDVPVASLAAPEFTATAMTGEQRSQGDLIGVPTVLWFYPAAFTGG